MLNVILIMFVTEYEKTGLISGHTRDHYCNCDLLNILCSMCEWMLGEGLVFCDHT